jgi:hypothetical protein
MAHHEIFGKKAVTYSQSMEEQAASLESWLAALSKTHIDNDGS